MSMHAQQYKAFLTEAVGLFGFVVLAGLAVIFLEHPDMPVMKGVFKDYPLVRRIPLGILMGFYIALGIKLAGKSSGAHFNPSVTWAFFLLKRITLTNAVCYTIAQFLGALAGAMLLKFTLPEFFGHPVIKFGATLPKPPHGHFGAFISEFVISFILMFVTLIVITSKKHEKKIALISGFLIAVYLVFETPMSGMSMNPARSFAGDFAGKEWEHLWLYFAAPLTAMFTASIIFVRTSRSAMHNLSLNSHRKEIPVYPICKV